MPVLRTVSHYNVTRLWYGCLLRNSPLHTSPTSSSHMITGYHRIPLKRLNFHHEEISNTFYTLSKKSYHYRITAGPILLALPRTFPHELEFLPVASAIFTQCQRLALMQKLSRTRGWIWREGSRGSWRVADRTEGKGKGVVLGVRAEGASDHIA